MLSRQRERKEVYARGGRDWRDVIFLCVSGSPSGIKIKYNFINLRRQAKNHLYGICLRNSKRARDLSSRTREFQPVEIIPISTTLVHNGGRSVEGRERWSCAAMFLHETYARSCSAGKLEGTVCVLTLMSNTCCVHVGGGSHREFTFVSEYEGRRTEKKKKKKRKRNQNAQRQMCVNCNVR